MPRRRAVPLLPALALLAVAGAAAGFGWVAAGEVETRLMNRMRLTAEASGWGWLRASADGAVLTLSGAAPDLAAAQAALAAAAKAAGGSGLPILVVDELSLAPAAARPVAAAPRPPWSGSLAAARDAGGITVEGRAPNAAARAALTTAIAEATGGAPLADRSADAGAAVPRRWRAAVAAAAASLAGLESGRVSLAPGVFAVTGAPRDEAARAAIEAAAARLSDEGWDALVALSLDAAPGADRAVPATGADAAPAGAGPWMAASLRDGRLSLRGEAPDEATRAAMLSYAAALFGPERVEDRSRLSAEPSPEGWRGATLAALDALAALDGGQVMARSGFVALRGVALAPSAVRRAQDALAPLAGRGWRAETRVTVDLPTRAASAPLPPARCVAALAEAIDAEPVRFGQGSAEIADESGPALDRLAGVLERCGDAVVEIGGHTDDRGSAAANRRLGQARAEAVRAALVARGAPAERLAARGYGAAEPVADNGTEEGRAANRRIAFRAVEEGEGRE